MGLFDSGMSRRDFMRLAMAGGGLAALNTLAGPVLERAYAADPCGTGSLNDIEHFVFLMMENRSFDHYFGTMSGVRGFADADKQGNLKQYGYNQATGQADPGSYLYPFRLDTTQGTSLDGECIHDPTHNWGPMHRAWNNGRMDQWVNVHVADAGPQNGPAAMGYYLREDIPVHWALADAFTICDAYHASVMGPTDPNRLYWISGTIDPDGNDGGPLLDTPTAIPTNKYSWRTYPENLQEAGVSWKVYTSQQVPLVSTAVLSGMLQSFKQTSDILHKPYLAANGVLPLYPTNFALDVKTNRLPKVSWIIPPLLNCEHPALPPSFGAVTLLEVLDTLTSNPAVWEKTALIISYDENGGFYDHVAPPTPPKGEPQEWITKSPLPSTADGIAGPIGLGFRVPGIVVSPYSRGGLVCSDTFDHTSQLRLVETRYGVEVPNLSAWRRKTVGDMTTAFNFAAEPSTSFALKARAEKTITDTLAQCQVGVAGLTGTFDLPGFTPFPVPVNSKPVQERGPARGRPRPAAACAPTQPAPSSSAAAAPASTAAVRPSATAPSDPASSDPAASDPAQRHADTAQPPTRIAEAAAQITGRPLAATGPDFPTERAALTGAALLALGAVTVAAAPRISKTVSEALQQE